MLRLIITSLTRSTQSWPGARPPQPAAPVAGCLLDRVEPPLAKSKVPRVRAAAAEISAAHDEIEAKNPIEVGPVTFAADVAAIFQQKCQSCHRPGQVGPFPLLTYDDAHRRAAMIREVVDDRRMPPWHADPRYGHFDNDRGLTARQRATVLAWVDQGAAVG